MCWKIFTSYSSCPYPWRILHKNFCLLIWNSSYKIEMRLSHALKKKVQINEVQSFFKWIHQQIRYKNDFNFLKEFNLEYIAGKPQWITIMAIVFTTAAKCNCYFTIMDLKMDQFLVEMREARKIGGQIHKLIN